MMEEIWKAIEGYEGKYQVSNLGRVRSVERKTTLCNQHGEFQRKEHGRIKSQGMNRKDGYRNVKLYRDGKMRTLYVHRLVAQAFIPNPDNLPEVNHKDEDTTNNRVDNLEWCSSKYNSNYGVGSLVRYQQKSYRVARIDKDGNILREYPSLLEAARQTGEAIRTIRNQCTKKTKLKSESKKSKLVFYRWKFIE
jgi:hypothetical protein